MKKAIVSLIVVLFATPIFAQQLTNDSIFGTWKIVDAKIDLDLQKDYDEESKKLMEEFRKGFINSEFHFAKTMIFNIELPKNAPSFLDELISMVNNKNWKIMDKNNISIGTAKDNYSLFGFDVIKKKNKIYFFVMDTPILLEVIRI